MKVLKFGGTSLGSAAMMRQVAEIIRQEDDCIVVCSAMSGVTNQLLELSCAWKNGDQGKVASIFADFKARFRQTCFGLFQDEEFRGYYADAEELFRQTGQMLRLPHSKLNENWLLSRGEVITTVIFSRFLNNSGIGIQWMNALDILHINQMGEPVVSDITMRLNNIPGFCTQGRFLTQGFICRDHEGNVANLQRGGSDYTATLLGAAVNASVIEIWTDIDGLRQNDPREVPNTRVISELSFEEAAELAYFGAKILHPSCVVPAAAYTVPIRLKNTMQPLDSGTLICRSASGPGIRAVAAKDGISVIRIRSARMLNAYGFLRRVFEVFEKYKTPIDVITTSEVSVSLTIDDPVFLQEICAELSSFKTVETETGQSIVCVVGDVLSCNQGWASVILRALRHLPVKMVSLGGSRNNLTLVLPSANRSEALNNLQKTLFSNTYIISPIQSVA